MDLVLGDLPNSIYSTAVLCIKKRLLSRSVDREHDWAANKAEAGLSFWAVESARLYAGLVYILGLLDVQLGLVTRESPQHGFFFFILKKIKISKIYVRFGKFQKYTPVALWGGDRAQM